MADVKITVRNNGPFRIEAPEGSIELIDHDGTKHDLTGKTAFSLCRCGGSANKPYCDGTHKTILAKSEPTAGAPGDKPQA
jgi:CDGSH-type Zn-finger protein